MHIACMTFVLRVVTLVRPKAPVLEIGSRDINGGVRRLFSGVEYFGIDLDAGPGVDLVADGATYSPEQPVNTVVCTEVLEHSECAGLICDNAWHCLNRGGIFILTAAGTSRKPHSKNGGELPPGEFYRNVSAPVLRTWLSSFSLVLIEEDEAANDIRALAVK